MKKINLILILLIIVGVVSVSGCISYQPNTSNVTLSDLNDSNVKELNTIDEIKMSINRLLQSNPLMVYFLKNRLKKHIRICLILQMLQFQ